nr:PREDICTED: uncharacterized protein LOC108952395 isoform X1 [Musa acuminata subsp. malaccensis]
MLISHDQVERHWCQILHFHCADTKLMSSSMEGGQWLVQLASSSKRQAFNKFGANCGPEAVWYLNYACFCTRNNLNTIIRNQINPSTFRTEIGGFLMCLQTGALLLDGNTPNYFGKNSPINLVLVGGAEYYRIINGLDLEDKLHPGGPFDPTGAGR